MGQHAGVDMYRNVGLRVTRRWFVYLVHADLIDLLCHTGRRRISYSLQLKHQILDNIIMKKVLVFYEFEWKVWCSRNIPQIFPSTLKKSNSFLKIKQKLGFFRLLPIKGIEWNTCEMSKQTVVSWQTAVSHSALVSYAMRAHAHDATLSNRNLHETFHPSGIFPRMLPY